MQRPSSPATSSCNSSKRTVQPPFPYVSHEPTRPPTQSSLGTRFAGAHVVALGTFIGTFRTTVEDMPAQAEALDRAAPQWLKDAVLRVRARPTLSHKRIPH